MNSPVPAPEYPRRSYPLDQEGSGEISVMALLDIIARRWILIAGIALAVTIAAIAASFLMTPLYQATSQVKIDPAARTVTDEPSQQTSPQADQSRIDTEVEILRSRDIAGRVVRDLNLTSDPEFRPESETAARSGAETFDRVVENFLDHLEIARNSDNYIVSVNFRSEDPGKAAKIANAVAQAYVASTVEGRTANASEQAKFLSQRLNSLGQDVQSSEQQLAQYRSQAGIVEGTTQGTIADQQVGPVAVQLAQAESEAASAQADLNAARTQVAKGQLTAVSSVLNSPVIANLRSQRAQVADQLAQIEARYGPRHPEYTRVKSQLDEIDQGLREEAERIVSGLASRAQAAQARAASLRSSMNQVRSEQAANTRAAVTADSLEREVKAKQEAYDQLAQTLQQVNQQRRNMLPNAVIAQRASVPLDPYSPNRILFGAIGLMIGLILGLGSAVLIELLSRRIRTSTDLEREVGAPFLASIPRLTSRQLRIDGERVSPERFAVVRPMSSYVEAFRVVRNSIVLSAQTPPKTIAILSALPGEGKSTSSLSLARVMALSGDRTILIDCDLRRGRLGSMVGAADRPGLVEVLTGNGQLADAVVKDPETDLDILPLRDKTFTPVDLFSGEAMHALLADLRERYDFVILDTAPVLAVADSRIVASLCDTSIFIARSESTPPRAARAAADLIRHDGTTIGGSILSMVSLRGGRLSASDPAYYSAKYRQYREA
ncbi:polysaccharide biosynthesis tyrosine autokinase [Stakelama sp. CBK3Z-3]|uniref:non-specific protein-tyrosine kinase n=1 Tax=Stakelama flava TaxID=2860338 RepID=A0ABS6XI89_9SPHN|nr:polysaccharide biosynthesis tyrosine autokinase [Stakelama flava]MBW4329913.1 polysaccharide biosynthesis tyrosine autokinase [Stakelama flava]